MIRHTKHDSTRRSIKHTIASHCQPTKWLPIKGFTLLELITVILIISILFAFMAPNWATFMTVQRLNTAQDSVLQALRNAQSRAKQNRIVWQASFQTANGTVQWSIHPASTTPTPSLWNSLDPNIQIDEETTLQLAGGLRKVQFDHQGNVNGQLGRLTVSSKSPSSQPSRKIRRCVIVSTLLGAIRTGSEHTAMQDDKYCY